ncbi:FliM/FliN family flagellar motor switch protein [uncultured Hyphomonas sp.]|uniref:FliM/FliN family flagellar motor switch protein n=1 Tax=uncultured Hyphomonas sp. TaxID=225298 RepID=UPI002AAAD544|nr:FliM/FliN family flagellar motor switch protein [uncultured Hyphomonas sp.]
MKSDLPLAADDGWDMSPRRESAVMVDMPTSFEPLSSDRPLPSARGVLSAAEIEALLRPDLSDLPESPPEPAPETIEDKPLPEVAAHAPEPAVADTPATDIPVTARRLASRLSLALRKGCGLRAAAAARSVHEGDFDSGLTGRIAGQGSAIACFAVGDGEVDAMLVLSPELANALIETACGGNAMPGDWSPRELTPLDSALLEGLVRPLGHAIAPGLGFAGMETEADFAAALARPGTAEIIDFEIRVDGGRHAARLILSSEIAEAAAPEALPAPQPAQAAAPIAEAAPSSVTVLLTARVASLSVPLSRLSDLTAGSTLLLGVPADQPVELLSGGRDGPVVAEAQIGRKGNKMALRISRRVPGFR